MRLLYSEMFHMQQKNRWRLFLLSHTRVYTSGELDALVVWLIQQDCRQGHSSTVNVCCVYPERTKMRQFSFCTLLLVVGSAMTLADEYCYKDLLKCKYIQPFSSQCMLILAITHCRRRPLLGSVPFVHFMLELS